MSDLARDRRGFLAGVTTGGLVLISSGAHAAERARAKPAKPTKGEDIPPTEDLMREHGVLRRLLLVYDEAARRLGNGEASVAPAVAGAAGIVRRFVEGYHEKLEEEFVLPTLEKAGQLVELAKVIRVQHAVGRKLTQAILAGATAGKLATAEGRRALIADVQSFGRMYAAHAAWEDTEVFPAYRERFSEAELDKLGDQFEEQEHKLLGGGGFEGSLREVADLEKTLGIHDLAKFTPA